MQKLLGALLCSTLISVVPLSARADSAPAPAPASASSSGPAEAPPAAATPAASSAPLTLSLPPSSFEKVGRWGLGAMVGDLGLQFTIKAFLGSSSLAFQAGIGAWYGYGVGFIVDGDLIYEFPSVYSDNHFALNWYLGVGLTIGVEGGAGTCSTSSTFGTCAAGGVLGGGQAVGGFAGQLKMVPIEFAVEYRPTILGGPGGIVGPGFYNFVAVARYFFR